MKKILKYISYCLPVLALAVGCTKADGISEFQPATNKSGNVTLLASIENADSRAQVVATGEARWLRNDAIAVVCDDGSVEKFNLDGTGDTRRALFTGVVEGKSVGEYALYPANATYSNGTLTATLPETTPIAATGSCSVMAGVINEKNEVEFKQLTAYVALQLSKVSDKAKTIVISSDKSLSGEFSINLPGAFETGIMAIDGDNTITIDLGGSTPSTVNAFFPIPVGDYSYLKATAYSEAGISLGEVSLSSGNMSASSGLLLSYNLEMPGASKPAVIPGTVNVAGIYWAVGNLEYQKDGATSNGFAEGWCIAPNQAHYFDASVGTTRTYENYDKRDVFNLGGIADPFDCEATSAMNAAVGTNISGLMYTDQACTAVTTDFAAAKYGDIAHWASRGQYRMPSYEDISKLVTLASSSLATYTLDGVAIAGVYFVDPEVGSEPVHSTETMILTDADLQVGLFLPYNGRGYNKSSIKNNRDNRYDVFNTGSNCIYNVSVVKEVDPSTKNYVSGGCYGYIFNASQVGNAETVQGLEYLNGAMNSTARFAIRPIYVSGNAGPVNPTPTPTPTPDPTPDPTPEPEPTPDVPVDLPEFVTVAGIEWSMGNLEYEVGAAGATGFAAGWSLAPHPAHHFHLGSSGDLGDRDNYNQVSHFNFGGIADPITNLLESAVSLASSEPAFDFSGKMYTDRNCINETTDFSAAKFGDIAFWASNGTLRTPSADEFATLYAKASRTKAVYTYEGVEVSGTYFFDPAAGTDPVVDTENIKTLVSADLAVGLFLPHTGRTYAANDYKLYAVNSIGVYRTTTVNLNSTLEATNGVIYRVSYIQESEKNSKGLYGSFYHSGWGANGRYAIRPVKVK